MTMLHRTRHFLARFSASRPGRAVSLTEGAQQALAGYAWPGNVRELQNIVERLVLMTQSDRVDRDDLPAQLVAPGREKLLRGLGSEKLSEARAAFEREFLEEKLREYGGNISRTAEAVGLARESLSRKLRSMGIQVEKHRDAS